MSDGWTIVALVVAVLCVVDFWLEYQYRKAQAKVLADNVNRIKARGADQVAVITGANSGVGIGLVESLGRAGINVVLACRNPEKAKAAMAAVRAKVPDAKLDLVIIDVSDMDSVEAGAAQIRAKYRRLDYLFLNAGILPWTRHMWFEVLRLMATMRIQAFFQCARLFPNTPLFLETPLGLVTKKGLGLLFATHVLGHYKLIQCLKPLLDAAPRPRVIWSGSRGATDMKFDWDHVECLESTEGYGNSKYGIDLLNVGLNRRLKTQGDKLQSFVCCPGVTRSQMTPLILKLIFPFIRATRWWNECPVFPVYGSLAHLAVAAGEPGQFALDKKWCLFRTQIKPGVMGCPPVSVEQGDRFINIVDAKLKQFSSK